MPRRLICLAILAGLLLGFQAFPASAGPAVVHQDPLVLVITKSANTATLFKEGQAVKKYVCVFGVNPDGDKVRQGDNRTPEGTFYITDKEKLGNHPYLGRTWFGLSYPAPSHAERARKQSLISAEQYQAILEANRVGALPPQNTSMGGWVGIHGGREDLTKEKINWTEGCIAMLEADLEELYSLIKPGTKVVIES